jgi:catechol 2,3-dioxygenase-like lactoylglutathione lyase family enzyme
MVLGLLVGATVYCCRPATGDLMSNTKSTGAVTVGVECIIPILRVNSVAASIRFYVDVLGFKVDWGGEDGSFFASVSRDGRAIMLCQGDQGQPGTWIWIGVEDIGPLFAEYSAKGATIREKPTNYPWAYEMKIEDPDGHVLRFGSEPRSGDPFREQVTASSST